MISTLEDLEAALLVGGDVVCDPNSVIDVTGANVTVSRPTRLITPSLVAETGPALLVESSTVRVEDPQIVGGNAGVYDNSQKLIYALGTPDAPLSDVQVIGATMSDSAAHNIWLEWCTDSKVERCTIGHGLYSGIMLISANGVGVADNDVTDMVIAPGNVDCYGIAVTDSLNTPAARSQRVTVSGNRVSLVDHEGIDTHGGLGIAITGNSVTACHEGIALVSGNSTRVTSPAECTVTGNVVDGTGARNGADAGIILAGFSGVPASGVISGNVVTGYATPFRTMFWDRSKTTIVGNSQPQVPWTAPTLANDWTQNPSFPAMYCVDGDMVYWNGGGLIPPVGGPAGHQVIGAVANAAGWPSQRTFFSVTKGSNSGASTGVIDVDSSGNLRDDYDGTDSFTRWMTGSYRAI